MILQALKEYYDRKAADPESGMAPPGFEWKEIPYVIVLGLDGIPVSLNQTYEGEGKKRRAKRFLVPQAVKKTSGIAANLLWDNPEYVLGIVMKGRLDRVKEQHAAFRKRIAGLGDVTDDGLASTKKFLKREDKEEMLQGFGEVWEQLKKEGSNITFSLSGDMGIIPERPRVKSAFIESNASQDGGNRSICLVTGDHVVIERLHAPIKGVYGAQTSGANIVSFNLDAFRSFGKEQGANAPVGTTAAFAYTTALNHLLARDSRQRMQVGDASTVFWAERANDLERQIAEFFGEPPKDDPDRGVKAVESLFRSIENGSFRTGENEKNRFYVLGLSPNASRIAIRFWIVDTVAGMAAKIKEHFDDLRIVHGPKDRDVFPLFLLLKSTAVLGNAENIPPNLAGETMRAILQGLPYPQTLFHAAIRRIKAEQSAKNKRTGRQLENVTYPRAALIKAYINRSTRFKNPNSKEELKMSLDECNTNIGYRLGRLFAALERIQQEASPGINATIRDRFYGAASGTPSTVFGNLMRLKNHHLAKLESAGRKVFFEKLLCQILDGIEAAVAFPPHLSLEDQGRFAIGYYHQMQRFFTRKTDDLEQTTKQGEER
ncbi:MAG TPA: type I-C CRISPR-associated protein Cas8c/Csd1 [Thermodesulfobacteriota bacterium]|nr:type I-C CRISPR-associated protein Cas8c/Csd1 [Thermodesulfobacteriota bacterium]